MGDKARSLVASWRRMALSQLKFLLPSAIATCRLAASASHAAAVLWWSLAPLMKSLEECKTSDRTRRERGGGGGGSGVPRPDAAWSGAGLFSHQRRPFPTWSQVLHSRYRRQTASLPMWLACLGQHFTVQEPLARSRLVFISRGSDRPQSRLCSLKRIAVGYSENGNALASVTAYTRV
ncbi:hypothetical protein B0T24DRAFT_259314 [Lasiosphaeria ovina]|uniref:Uncharacterized protein n=1 Tax=Lasiosphaeria ovina TaxID=92902 RepID=A0AAE0KBD8_9PEZI|nr:hypothetical protein B0T24DRAFT_259314 [Lasiosphaeria ovina]